jgi:hypothetical protein
MAPLRRTVAGSSKLFKFITGQNEREETTQDAIVTKSLNVRCALVPKYTLQGLTNLLVQL